MRTLIVLVVFTFFYGQLALGQQYDAEVQSEIELNYFGSVAFYEATQLEKNNQSEEANLLFLNVADEFEKNNQWEAYVEVIKWIAEHNFKQKKYSEGIISVENAQQKLEKIDSPNYKLVSILIKEKARFLFELGEEEKAILLIKEDLNIWETKERKTDDWPYIMSLEVIGNLLYNQKKYKESLPFAEKALEISRQLNFNHPEHSLKVLGLYKKLLTDCGLQQKSAEFSRELIEIANRILDKNDFRLVKEYERAALTLFSIGEFSEGLKNLEKGIFILENNDYNLDKEQALFVCSLYKSAGIGSVILEQNENALEYYQKGLKALYDGKVDNLIFEVMLLGEIGHAYENLRDYKEALIFIKKADRKLKDAYRKDSTQLNFYHPIRNINYHFARYYNRQNEIRKSLNYNLNTINHFSNPNAPWENQYIYNDVSSQYFKLGQIDSALYFNQKSIQTLVNDFEPTSYFHLPRLEDVPSNRMLYALIEEKVKLLKYQTDDRKDSQKRTEDYDKLLGIIKYFDNYHELNLLKVNSLRSGNNKSLIASSLTLYQMGLNLAYKNSLILKEGKYIEEAFYFAQKKKAQGLWLNTLSNEAINQGFLPDSLLRQEKQFLASITEIENEIFFAQKKGNTEKVKILENTSLFEIKEAYNRFVKTLEENYPKYFESKYAFYVESSQDIQALLKEDEILLEYVQVDSTFYIFCLSKNQTLEIEKVDLGNRFQENIDILTKKLHASSWNRKQHRQQLVESSHQLYQFLIKPIEERIESKKRLIVIGEGLTHYIPFEVLLKSNEIKAYHKLDYLLKDFEISYHYSANLFAKARRANVEEKEGLLAFAPVYEDASEKKIEEDYFNPNLRAFNMDGSFSPLPWSEREVNSIYDRLEPSLKDKTNLLLRSAANKKSLVDNLEQAYRFIHIAGHSFADLDQPKFSGIACWQNGEMKDQILFTSEIYNLRLQADLVVLSSCESGYGKYDASEGVLGLNRAFVYAGADNVIFSLWKVFDKVSAELMVDLYENLFDGLNYTKSLREAKLGLLKNPKTAAPHLWSSFLLIGR